MKYAQVCSQVDLWSRKVSSFVDHLKVAIMTDRRSKEVETELANARSALTSWTSIKADFPNEKVSSDLPRLPYRDD